MAPVVVIWLVDIVLDAIILRVLPGLETDNWLTAVIIAVLVQLSPLPLPLLSGIFDIGNLWISACIVFALNAIILTLSTALFSTFRSHSVLAVPTAAAIFAGASFVAVPAIVGEIAARLGAAGY
jgi:hypothetical protein